MRIAVWHSLSSGGGKRALHDHVRGLVSSGHHVEAWCSPTADRDYLPLADLVEEHVVPLRRTEPRRKTRLQKLVEPIKITLAKLAAMEEHCNICAQQIEEGDFDLLLAHPCGRLNTNALGKMVNLPSVLYLQEPRRHLYEASPNSPWSAPPRDNRRSGLRGLYRMARDFAEVQSRRIGIREEIEFAKGYDEILVNSYYSRESVLRAYGLDAKVCYLGIDTARFHYADKQRQPVVVGVGMFRPSKNIEFVIDAVGSMTRARPKLTWIGNLGHDDYIQQLEGFARERNVQFEPKLSVSDDEIVGILSEASLMAYAPRLEPFGLAPLEANACGLPVVAVAEGGVRETIVDHVNGLLVDHDPKAMGAAIEQLICDTRYARQLGRQAREYVVENWDVSGAVDRLEQRLLDVLTVRERTNTHSSTARLLTT